MLIDIEFFERIRIVFYFYSAIVRHLSRRAWHYFLWRIVPTLYLSGKKQLIERKRNFGILSQRSGTVLVFLREQSYLVCIQARQKCSRNEREFPSNNITSVTRYLPEISKMYCDTENQRLAANVQPLFKLIQLVLPETSNRIDFVDHYRLTKLIYPRYR